MNIENIDLFDNTSFGSRKKTTKKKTTRRKKRKPASSPMNLSASTSHKYPNYGPPGTKTWKGEFQNCVESLNKGRETELANPDNI